ncbi:MAG: hypothetical protein F4Y97_02205 [Dehalococcoidia bacterium]|nr:hypothetical protein [Dehalococcoidia bacterium]
MALTFRPLLALLLLGALALGACGGGPSGPQPVSGEAAADEAAPLTDELRELLEEVAEVRGLEAPPGLQARAVAPEDLEEAYWEGWTEQEVRYWLDSRTIFLQILGHLDRDESQDLMDLQLGFIGGFYSYDETLWVVTDKDRIDLDDLTQWELLTLVHEMVHAIQDHHFDLVKTSGATSNNIDPALAWSAVVEGDAIYHEGRWAEAALGIPADEVLTIGGWDDLPPGLLREFYFPYTAGADAVTWFIEAHGRDALNALLLDPPSATSQILHPELLASGWEPEYLYTFSTIPQRQIRVSLGILWAPRHFGTLGEFHLANYLLGDAPFNRNWFKSDENREVLDAVAGWTGDRYYLFANPEGEAALVAYVRFADEGEAREFAETHRAIATRGADVATEGDLTLATQDDGRVVGLLEPTGRDVVFAVGTSAEVVRKTLAPIVED